MVPPVPNAVALPVLPPLQATLVVPLMLAETPDALVITAVAVAVQLEASVTVIVYVPTDRLLIDELLPPGALQLYVNGLVPPVTLAVAEPLLFPQVACTGVVVKLIAAGVETVTDAVAPTHPCKSFSETV